MLDLSERLNNIERRLVEIETRLGIAPLPAAPARPATPAPAAPVPAAVAPVRPPVAPAAVIRPAPTVSATQWMAWGAGLALLLAAVYFLKLVYDTGWLTPDRQLGLATLAGAGLVAAGLFFARVDRAYAAYLPALGLIILYLTAYTGHLYYRVLTLPAAIVAISVVTLLGIWLGRRFENSVFVIVAAVGVYLSPLLLAAAPHQLLDVVIYYSAWSLLFSFCALTDGRRITYMLPMLFALVGFDAVWRLTGEVDWLLAVIYQLVQLVVFASTAAAFSVIHRRPLGDFDGVVHGIALVLFYGIEYVVLKQHVPRLAPFVGVATAILLLVIYLAARAALKDSGRIGVGAVIVSTYCAVVVTHAVFFEWLPHDLFAWAALVPAVAVAVVCSRAPDPASGALRPVLIVTGLLVAFSYLSLLLGNGAQSTTVSPQAALAVYALALYGGYHLFRSREGAPSAAPIILYAAHLAFMHWASQAFGSGLALSMVWAVFAVVVLAVAMLTRDRLLGQSALLIFAAAGVKVLLHDLSASGSLPRVLTLVVLAVSLYLGGWLYQSLVRKIEE
jgi:uncharacterized membrane protein